MFSQRIQNFSIYLMFIVSINLVHHNSVTKCQSSLKQSQALGITKNLKKDKQKDITNALKAAKDIESETQMAIEDIVNGSFELTTLAVEYKELLNETNNETLNTIDSNSTSNPNSLKINETYETTPLFSSNVTKNDSFVPNIDETPDYSNGTENELLVNLTTKLSVNYSTPTPIPSIPTILPDIDNTTDATEAPNAVLPTQVTEALNESPFLSSTFTAIESLTQSSTELDFDMSSNEDMSECLFENTIVCKHFELICFGSGEVDCGSRHRRAADNHTFIDNSKPKVFKSYLEKQSQSENIENIKCVVKGFENMYFSCNQLPTTAECKGKSVCKPADKSADLDESLPFWKVGLIAALTAIGAICFIIVAIIAYVSYNKLKVRPELSANGCHNSPQNVTRV